MPMEASVRDDGFSWHANCEAAWDARSVLDDANAPRSQLVCLIRAKLASELVHEKYHMTRADQKMHVRRPGTGLRVNRDGIARG